MREIDILRGINNDKTCESNCILVNDLDNKDTEKKLDPFQITLICGQLTIPSPALIDWQQLCVQQTLFFSADPFLYQKKISLHNAQTVLSGGVCY